MIRRLRYWLDRRRREADLADELECHRAARQHALERDGFSARDAAAASRRAMGNMTLAREDARDIWFWSWPESVCQDVHYALTSLRRQPAFAAAALATLGAAMGLIVSLLTVINALMWRPWPVRDAPSMVSIAHTAEDRGISLAELTYFARNQRTFDGLIGTRCIDGVSDGCQVKLDGRPLGADFVTPNYFQVLGIGLLRGAGFPQTPQFLGSGETVAVISDELWTDRFGRDAAKARSAAPSRLMATAA